MCIFLKQHKHNMHAKHSEHREGGYTLLIALVFIVFFGAVIAAIVARGNSQELRLQATASGEYAANIARAARLFVRDRSLEPATAAGDAGDPFHRLRIASLPAPILLPNGEFSSGPDRDITVDDLIGAGLLPGGFGLRNGADFVTPLGHEVHIIAANVPILEDPRTNDNVVASAYIYLRATARTLNETTKDLVVGLRGAGVAVSSPLFDAAGNNLTTTICRGDPAVALWDTGCLNADEFTELTGDADFAPGSLIIPSWRSEQFDLRAVMRFPQPENPGYATMLTNLVMGEQIDTNGDGICDAVDQIQINDDGGLVESGICRVLDDDASFGATGQDNRFDIVGIDSLNTDGFIITPQSNGDVTTYYDTASASYINRRDDPSDPTIRVDNNSGTNPGLAEGLLVNGAAIMQNDVRIYDTMAMPAGVTQRLNAENMVVRRNVVLSNPDVGDAEQPDMLINGTASMDSLRAEEFFNTGPGATFDPDIMRQSTIDMAGNLTLRAGGNAAIERADVFSPNVTSRTATMTGLTNIDRLAFDETAPTLPGGLRAAIGDLRGAEGGTMNVQNLTINPNNSENSAVFGLDNDVQSRITGTLNISNDEGNAQCFGDCPDRCADPGEVFGGTICPP